MKWETKDKLLKIGFAICIIIFIIGIGFSYKECQRDNLEKILSDSKIGFVESMCIKLTNCPKEAK